jgi:hypothetical protein
MTRSKGTKKGSNRKAQDLRSSIGLYLGYHSFLDLDLDLDCLTLHEPSQA